MLESFCVEILEFDLSYLQGFNNLKKKIQRDKYYYFVYAIFSKIH